MRVSSLSLWNGPNLSSPNHYEVVYPYCELFRSYMSGTCRNLKLRKEKSSITNVQNSAPISLGVLLKLQYLLSMCITGGKSAILTAYLCQLLHRFTDQSS